MPHKQKNPFRASLFWDVDTAKIHPKKNAVYIAERIMEYGNDKEVRWMWKQYPKSFLKKVATTSRVLNQPTRALWRILTGN